MIASGGENEGSWKVVRIDGARITGRESFHDAFAEALGFPDWYGRNMDAWIDCMGYLDAPDSAMTAVHVAVGEVLTLHIDNSSRFKEAAPEQWRALLECSGSVNARQIKRGKGPLLALSLAG